VSAGSQRQAERRGQQRAILVVAHAIVVRAFHRLSRHEPYNELGAHDVDEYRRAPWWTDARGGSSGWAIVSASNQVQLRSRVFSR
jgi:hypothetical protein